MKGSSENFGQCWSQPIEVPIPIHYAYFTFEKIQGQTLKILEKIFNGKPRKDSLEFTLEDWTKVRVAFTLEFIRKVNYQP